MVTFPVAHKGERSDLRHFGTSTDDTAIYLEDSMDETTARCISSSPSVLAILSPQRLPSSSYRAVDITEYDSNNIGGGCNTKACGNHPLIDLTNTGSARTSFFKSPAPRRSLSLSLEPHRRACSCTSDCLHNQGEEQEQEQRPSHHYHGHCHTSRLHTTFSSSERGLESALREECTVSVAEYERLQRERNRFEKMYEHQKALYEDMAQKQSETYSELQKKIIEVVALSSRNEESKRFIRQLKREMSDNRTRVMNIQNRVLEESKQERAAKEQYRKQLCEYEERYVAHIEQQEAKVSGLEGLLKDMTSMKGESDKVHVSQLDALLKASYTKNTALFADLVRQARQIDMLFDSKVMLEKQLEQLRREKRDAEALWAEERRRLGAEVERYSAHIAEQQHSILDLRQMLVRTLEAATLAQGNCNKGNNEDGCDGDETDSSSYSSGCSSERAGELNEETESEEESEGESDCKVVVEKMGLDDTARPPLPHAELRLIDLDKPSAQS